jgi:hypothetical protein
MLNILYHWRTLALISNFAQRYEKNMNWTNFGARKHSKGEFCREKQKRSQPPTAFFLGGYLPKRADLAGSGVSMLGDYFFQTVSR